MFFAVLFGILGAVFVLHHRLIIWAVVWWLSKFVLGVSIFIGLSLALNYFVNSPM
jgi:hypothetical protein